MVTKPLGSGGENKAIAKASIVNLGTIAGDLRVTSDDIVALLVSKVDETITIKERNVRSEIEKLCGELNDLHGVIKKETDLFIAEQAKVMKTAAAVEALKVLGFKSPKVDVTGSADESEFVLITSITAVPNSDPRRRESGQLTSYAVVPTPKPIVQARADIKKKSSEKEALQASLMELRSYRQNEMTSLERWAKGQIAAQALQNAGGEMAELSDRLQGLLPMSVQKLLT